MLIQDYCQQERVKRCTITAKSGDPKTADKSDSDVERMETEETSYDVDGTRTPKAEPNTSPTPNDVEMVDTPDPVIVIKQEPEDEVTSIETDPLAEINIDENSRKSDTQTNAQVVKTEADENGNIEGNTNSSDNNKESESSDEPIKIEESTNDKDDRYSKDINIDPRTYCKLGHFHLLLEDYAKGKFLFLEIKVFKFQKKFNLMKLFGISKKIAKNKSMT